MYRDGVEIEFNTNAFVILFNIIDDDKFAALSFGYIAVEGECGIASEGRGGGVVVGDGAFQGNGRGGRDGSRWGKRIDTIG